MVHTARMEEAGDHESPRRATGFGDRELLRRRLEMMQKPEHHDAVDRAVGERQCESVRLRCRHIAAQFSRLL